VSDVRETYFGLTYEVQFADLSGASADTLGQLGRTPVDEDWQALKFDAYHAFYIEPLISQIYKGTGDRGPTTLAHEIALSARGQYAFNNRLIPNEQDVVGGMFSVRGYDESLVAGDSVLIGSAEYRFHWPRTWGVSEPGTVKGRPVEWARNMLGERMNNFRYAPQEPFGRADWDLIFKGFLDAGVTDVSAAVPGEDSYTLVGAGVGVELQIKRYLTARLEWGFALADVDQPGAETDTGDNRVHFLITGVY
jgi:hemolysin activation/secretion protein